MEHYLDNAATTKPCAEAAEAVVRCMTEQYGNPSSLHRKGLEAQHVMEHWDVRHRNCCLLPVQLKAPIWHSVAQLLPMAESGRRLSPVR